MTTISVTVFNDAEAWLRKNLKYLHSDNVACVYPVTSPKLEGVTRFVDREEGKQKNCRKADFLKGLQLLSEQVGNTLFVGNIHSPLALRDAGNWDAEVVDAYWQLVMLGEVIYG